MLEKTNSPGMAHRRTKGVAKLVNSILSDESVLGKAKELQQLVKERFGIDAYIEISAHSLDNHITKELANYIGFELAGKAGPENIEEYMNAQLNDIKWVKLHVRGGLKFVAFYD